MSRKKETNYANQQPNDISELEIVTASAVQQRDSAVQSSNNLSLRLAMYEARLKKMGEELKGLREKVKK